MKISKIHLVNMRNDGHFQFHTEFKDLLAKEGADRLNVQYMFESYLRLYEKYDIGLKKIVKSAFTERIHEADKVRDEIFIGMTEINKGALRHFAQDIRESAKRLKIVFDTYGNVSSKPYNEQTSAIYNLTQELRENYNHDILAVGIREWVFSLEERNMIFSNLMKERFDEAAAKTQIVVRVVRGEIDGIYHEIVENIDARVVIDGVGNYANFIRTLNVIIGKYIAMIHAIRGGKKVVVPAKTEELVEENK